MDSTSRYKRSASLPYPNVRAKETETQKHRKYKMVTVRKHSKRRIHAYAPGRSAPNALQKGNARRVSTGLRPIHTHRNINIVPLSLSLATHPEMAVYGWLRTQVSLVSADIAQRAAKNKARYKPVVNDVSRDSRVRRETLSRLAQARHKMELLLMEDMKVDLSTVRHKVLPTTQNAAAVGDVTGPVSISGWDAVPNALSTLAATDERYTPILELIEASRSD